MKKVNDSTDVSVNVTKTGVTWSQILFFLPKSAINFLISGTSYVSSLV